MTSYFLCPPLLFGNWSDIFCPLLPPRLDAALVQPFDTAILGFLNWLFSDAGQAVQMAHGSWFSLFLI
jgi:hypothetical protein